MANYMRAKMAAGVIRVLLIYFIILAYSGERAFSVAAPRLWNKLPLQIRLSSSEAVFKTNLKTHLFRRAFDL